MSTALGQVTGDLWLLAHPRATVPPSPYMRTPSLTQGSALPESEISGNQGQSSGTSL